MQSYALKPEFEKEMEAERDRLMRCRRLGLITSAQATEMLVGWIAPRIGDARMEPSAKTRICVVCIDCKAEHTMQADVKYYRCPCSPHRDRPTWNHHKPLA